MANKNLFQSIAGKLLPKANAQNEAGGAAYQLSPKQQLAQYVATGCLNSTFYASAEEQLSHVIALCAQLDAVFIAQCAVYAREKALMKDMPALLMAILSTKDTALFQAVFPRVINNGKLLRTFVQIMRSGVTGRKSLGTVPKRMINQWFEARTDEAIFKDSVGQAPSMADVVKMIHPKPATASRASLFAYFIGRAYDADYLPPLVRQYEAYKAGASTEVPPAVPNVPFQMLTALPLGETEWKAIARNAGWQMTRMNLNTFARHGVFNDAELTKLVANRLRDPQAIRQARAFPYQLFAAFMNIGADIPALIRAALQDAMEIAIGNVPQVNGKVYVLPDISGSMQSPVTGYRKGATTAVRCLDVAALVAAAVLRQNPDAEVIPFSDDVVPCRLNPRDSVMTNAEKLAKLPSGGTNCSAPLRLLNQRKAKGDLVIYVSDNESWMDTPRYNSYGNAPTETMKQWETFKQRNRQARLVCLDVQPYATTQANEREDILNIGGFSDQVFDVIAEFAAGRLGADHWVGVVESAAL